MLIKNKRYIVSDVIDQLNTGDIVRTNGDTKDAIWEGSDDPFVEGMIFKLPMESDRFFVFNNTHDGSGNGYARSHSKKYRYGWCIYTYNDEAWIELVGEIIEPKTLLLEKIKKLTKVTK